MFGVTNKKRDSTYAESLFLIDIKAVSSFLDAPFRLCLYLLLRWCLQVLVLQ